MKKRFTKLTAVCMAIAMAALIFIIPCAAATCDCPYDPIVYVYGKHELYCCDDNGNFIYDDNGEKILNTANNFDYGAMASELVPEFAKAVFSHDWTMFSKGFLDYVLPVYEGKGCDGNGDVIDYVHYKQEAVNELGWFEGTTHGYHMGWNNRFYYDYRESPIVIAKQLDDFITAVKERTGHDKVVIVTRCQGANLVMAWLQLYESGEESKYVDAADMPAEPYESVSYIALIDGCMEGIDAVEGFFSGRMDVDVDALYRFAAGRDLGEVIGGFAGEELGGFLTMLIDVLKETYGINLTASVLKNIYKELGPAVVSPMMRAFYATCGCNLAVVKDYFEDTINFIFPTAELKAEYAGLIEKATYIHDNVTMRTAELLTAASDAGVKVGVFAEYGFQSTPTCPESAYCGDDMTSVANQSIGCTASKVDGRLSDSYIARQTEAGLERYISPDRQIDASTCLFPDSTWFIKNLDHVFPEVLHELVVSFVRGKSDITTATARGVTSQFINFYTVTSVDDGTFLPLEEVNSNDQIWEGRTVSDIEQGNATATLLQKIIDFIRDFVRFIRGLIEDIVATAKA